MFLIVAYVINSAFSLTLCHKDYLFCYCLGLCRSQKSPEGKAHAIAFRGFLE